MISSASNGQIKEVIRLQKQSKYRRRQRTFIVEGIKMVEEAAQYGMLQRIYLEQGRYPELGQDVMSQWGDCPCEVVSGAAMKQISETVTPQGILAAVTIPAYRLEDILQDPNHRYILLDDLRDPGNLGTIMRTAEGAGMSGLIMSRESVDLFNPKVVRATMGSIFRVPYYYVENLAETVKQIQSMGCVVYGTAMEGSLAYDEPDYTAGAAVVIGNEANGVSKEVLQAAGGRIRIPMEGQVESLNAAVSAAVVMYEMNRQGRRNRAGM